MGIQIFICLVYGNKIGVSLGSISRNKWISNLISLRVLVQLQLLNLAIISIVKYYLNILVSLKLSQVNSKYR